MLELRTWRIGGHSRSDASGYRNKEEEAIWRARDPLILCREHILSKGWASNDELAVIESRVQERIEKAVEYAKGCPDPLPEDALKNVYWEGGK
jgi:pyruvate dehydrogenase E1 component alpha subunit